MWVYVDGQLAYTWPVSTAAWGYNTPDSVCFRHTLDPYHRSGRYGSPMPYSIFFTGGYAIHGSYDIGRVGYPAVFTGASGSTPDMLDSFTIWSAVPTAPRIIIGW